MARIFLLICLVEIFCFTQCAKMLIVPVEFPSNEKRDENSDRSTSVLEAILFHFSGFKLATLINNSDLQPGLEFD